MNDFHNRGAKVSKKHRAATITSASVYSVTVTD